VSPTEAFNQARQLAVGGDYASAEPVLQDFITRYGDGPKGPEARYWLGKAYAARAANPEAATAFIGAIREWPQTSWAPDAVVELSRALVRMRKPSDACQTLDEFARRYPKAAPAGAVPRHGDPCPGEMSGLIEGVHQVFDGRLATDCSQPLALALSGWGTSVALAPMAADWAGVHGRRLLDLTVDHGLNPASRGWTEACRDLAGRLGADFRPLEWTGPKPSTGLPAAARLARHRLLAEARPAGRGQCHADGSYRQRSG